MPSAYTSNIYNGKPETLASYLLSCAQQFGANSRFRDSIQLGELPVITPDIKYYQDKVKLNTEALNLLKNMTIEEVEHRIEQEHQANLMSQQMHKEENKELEARYRDMIGQVTEWEPPTEEHIRFKEFALDQLTASLEFDCGYQGRRVGYVFKKPTFDQYVTKKTIQFEEDIEYYTRKIEDEIEYAKKANAWNTALRNSFK